MAAPLFPEPRTVETNGIRMAVWEQGEGLPVVFSHGFPELAYSWRYQLGPLAEAGFRAIAPDQRGYGATDCPARVEDYDMPHLTGDLAGLLDALGLEKAVFCGHDWGGAVVWAMAQLHPDRVAGVIGVNTPFRPRSPVPPVELMRQMFGDNFYIVHFQKRGEADEALASDTRRVFEALMRRVPDVDVSEYAANRGALNMVEMVRRESLGGEPLLSPEELEYYVEAFERTGFTGGINWYRNIDRNWKLGADLPQTIEVPSLMVCAEKDVALPPEMADGMEQWVTALEKHVIPDCGHWTQQEKPEELNRILIDWLERTF